MPLSTNLDPLFLLWGKRRAQTDIHSPNFHPLIFHMLDVAAVAEALLQKGPRSLSHSLIKGLHGTKPGDIAVWIVFLTALHDIGKATASFQKKWLEKYRQLKNCGFNFHGASTDNLRHGTMTAAIVEPFLVSLRLNEFSAKKIGVVLGGHHGRFPTNFEIQNARGLLNTEKSSWQMIRRELFYTLARHFSVQDLLIPTFSQNNAFYLRLAAFISVADWIGSIEKPGFFEYSESNIPLEAYWSRVREKAPVILERLGWVEWRPPIKQARMEELFPFIAASGLRPVQASVVQLRDRLDQPGLVIIEAPMGQGKTEAAMFLADQWAVRLRQVGTYFGLPTQATSNQMFGRIRDFLNQRYPEEKVNYQLMHGHAALSEEFEVLRRFGYNPPIPSEIDDEKQTDGSVFAAEWFTYKKRGLLAPFGVGTVDQVILAVLQTKHYFIRLWGLGEKTVIIDEIHAYDAYMLAHLKNLMSWLAALGSSVVLLSATLPCKRRRELIEAFEDGLGSPYEIPHFAEAEYPRVTWVSHGGRSSLPVKRGESRKIALKWIDGSIPEASVENFDLGRSLSEALIDGGCAVVIVNTVDRAQKMYRALEPWFPESDAGDGDPVLDLFHARFRFLDRSIREQRVLRRFGKPGSKTRRPHRAVLVATQVVEQSLDLDFDLMVSDLAPVDLVLQRAGRLHRHDRARPPKLTEPALWMIQTEMDGDQPRFDLGAKAVYAEAILLKSLLVLQKRSSLELPLEMEPLIEAVYGEENHEAFEGFMDEILHFHGELLADSQWKKFQAQLKAIPSPNDSDFLEKPTDELFEDDPFTHPTVSALTRLSGPSIELVVLWGNHDMPRLEPGGEPVDLSLRPEGLVVKELLQRSLRLSLAKVVQEFRGMEAPEGWVRSAWLRNHRPLIFDATQNAVVGHFLLTLDPELGLVVQSNEEK